MRIPPELELVVPLDKTHDRSLFDCGSAPLNRYLQQQARQDMLRNISVTFVVPDQHQIVRGFYTLCASAIEADELPADVARRLPRYGLLPVTLLGRLAVDKPYHAKGVGQFLLLDALRRSLEHSKSIGAMAIVVHAKDRQAAQFYQQFGFEPFKENPLNTPQNALFLAMQHIASLFSS